MVPATLKENSVYLIDASAFVFRAYYALAPLSSKGRPSHAVAGFASMLFKILKDKRPGSCVVVFDSKKPSFRKEIYKDYKANREVPPPDLSDQIKAVREMCEQAHLPTLQQEGIEADDLIASYVKTHKKRGPIVIVSSDKDLTQLVDKNVVMYDSFRERILGPEEVLEKYGVAPEKMLDFLSLTGDSSDNIPGIKGVGPKTAIQLLEAASVEEMLKNPKKLPEKWREKIEAQRDALELSQRLVRLKDDIEISDDALKTFHGTFPQSLKNFLLDWDCTRLVDQYGDLMEGGATRDAASTSAVRVDSSKLSLATTKKDLEFIREELQKVDVCVLDFETDSFSRQTSRAVGYSLAWSDDQAWYVPLKHAGASVDGRDLLAQILTFNNLKWVAHNWKFDSEVLKREGLPIPTNVADTMLEAYLLHADRRSFSLSNLAQEFVGEAKGDLEGLLGESQNFGDVPLDQAKDYAAQDARLTLKLHEQFFPDIQKSPEVKWLFQEVEVPLSRILGGMEQVGIKVNPKTLTKLSKELHEQLSLVEKKIYELAEGEFNINSPKQLQAILFEKLKLTPKKKTKTGFSTDESVLQELALEHPLPGHLVEFRGLSKLLSTYVDVLPGLVAQDGRIHTQYHQTGTATGRLSSSEPNLQNIPIRSEEGKKIRSAFVAEEGFELMSADYSQVELRLFAHMSGDQKLIGAFKAGRDIHAETAKIIFGSSDSEFRSRAKAINFGIIYGISAFGLSQQLKISRGEAAKFIESYFEQFPGIKTFMEDLVKRAQKDLQTVSLFGRRRPLPDIHSKNPTLRAFAERVAINAPVQGTAADIMKSAMVRIQARLHKTGCKSRLLLQVHDELVLEVASAEKENVQALVVEEMQDLSSTPVGNLSVPLIVDSGFGSNWAEL